MPGVGLRIVSDVLRTRCCAVPALLDRVHRFTQVLNIQISHTAACNAHHNLPERLARWLLMAHDRAESDALPLTQEFVSMMLAVRRPGVTVAARSFQAIGAIDYERGRITRPRPPALGGSLVRMLRHRSGSLSPRFGLAFGA